MTMNCGLRVRFGNFSVNVLGKQIVVLSYTYKSFQDRKISTVSERVARVISLSSYHQLDSKYGQTDVYHLISYEQGTNQIAKKGYHLATI